MTRQFLKKLFWAFLGLFLATLVAMATIDANLNTSATPNGIISFELCAFTSSCTAALAEWGERGQQLAMLSLGLDYLFLLLYPGLVCMGLLLIAPKVPGALKRATVLMAWLSPGAGVADALENYALVQVVLSGSGEPYAWYGGVFAAVKFVILGITLLWLLFTSVALVLPKR